MSVREHDEQITTELQQLRKSIEKVKVSREVADALNTVLPNGNISGCIEAHVKGWNYEPKKPLNNLTTEEFARCCLYGYEVEQTPEEQLCQWYREENLIWGYHLDGEVEAKITVEVIEKTLDILGIKIKDINE